MTRRTRLDRNIDGRLPVRSYTADQLHRFLVEDAVKHHATDLPWMIAACTRIGKLSRRGAEQAFLDVVAEVEALTGVASMPAGSLSDAELRRLLQ